MSTRINAAGNTIVSLPLSKVSAINLKLLGEELFGLGFENLPGRIGEDDIEAAATVDDLIEFVAPVEAAQSFKVGEFDRAFLRLAFGVLLFVPG